MAHPAEVEALGVDGGRSGLPWRADDLAHEASRPLGRRRPAMTPAQVRLPALDKPLARGVRHLIGLDFLPRDHLPHGHVPEL